MDVCVCVCVSVCVSVCRYKTPHSTVNLNQLLNDGHYVCVCIYMGVGVYVGVSARVRPHECACTAHGGDHTSNIWISR